jgi:hypothetical protein
MTSYECICQKTKVPDTVTEGTLFEPGLRIRIHFIRIRHFRMNTNPDPIRIQGFNDQKLKKITAEKKFKKRPSNTSKHEIFFFCGSFLPS